MSAVGRGSERGGGDSHSCHQVVIVAAVLVAADISLAEQTNSFRLREERRLELLRVSTQAVHDVSLEI